jgi:hypothetical protein
MPRLVKIHILDVQSLYVLSPKAETEMEVEMFFIAIDISKRVREKRNGYNILVEETKRGKSLGRYRRRRENNIKMDLKEIGWEVIDWIDVSEDIDK